MLENYSEQYELSEDIFTEMYDVDQKIKFVKNQYGNQALSSQQIIVRFFSNTGFMERKLNKDLCMFNNVEMEVLFEILGVSTQATFYNRKNIIRQYLSWSASESLIDLNSIKWLDNFTIEQFDLKSFFSSKYFKDFEDVNEGLNIIMAEHKPIDEWQYMICVIPTYLAWMGLTIQQSCDLKIENIDFENNCIIIDNVKYLMNDTISKYIHDSLNVDGYIVRKGKGRNGSQTITLRENNYILKKLKTSIDKRYVVKEVQQKMSMFTKVTADLPKNNRYHDHSFVLKNVRDSGSFYRIYQYEKETSNKIEDVEKSILTNLMKQNDISNSKYHNFIEDYRKWKNYFYGI